MIYMKKPLGLWLHQCLTVSMEQSLHMGRLELAKRTRWKVSCVKSLWVVFTAVVVIVSVSTVAVMGVLLHLSWTAVLLALFHRVSKCWHSSCQQSLHFLQILLARSMSSVSLQVVLNSRSSGLHRCDAVFLGECFLASVCSQESSRPRIIILLGPVDPW